MHGIPTFGKKKKTYCIDLWFQEHFIKQNLSVWKQLVSIYVSGVPVLLLFTRKSQLHAYDSSLSFWLASAFPRPAGNTQPWLWNVFTFWACYKLSAKTNFAWLGRSLHLAQMLFGSVVFQGLALSIWLSLSDGVL